MFISTPGYNKRDVEIITGISQLGVRSIKRVYTGEALSSISDDSAGK